MEGFLDALWSFLWGLIWFLVKMVLDIVEILEAIWKSFLNFSFVNNDGKLDLSSNTIYNIVTNKYVLIILGLAIGVAAVCMVISIGYKAVKNMGMNIVGRETDFSYVTTGIFNLIKMVCIPVVVVGILLLSSGVGTIMNVAIIGVTGNQDTSLTSGIFDSSYQLNTDMINQDTESWEKIDGLYNYFLGQANDENSTLHDKAFGLFATDTAMFNNKNRDKTFAIFSDKYIDTIYKQYSLRLDDKGDYEKAYNQTYEMLKTNDLKDLRTEIFNSIKKDGTIYVPDLKGNTEKVWFDDITKLLDTYTQINTGYNAKGDQANNFNDNAFVLNRWQWKNNTMVQNLYTIDAGGIIMIALMSGVMSLLIAVLLILAERMFSIIFLLFVSPFTLAVGVNDDNKRWSIWVDTMVSKIIGAVGLMIAMSLFFAFNGLITGLLITGSEINLYQSIAKCIIMLGGISFAQKGGQMLSSLVSSQLGSDETFSNNALRNLGHQVTATAGRFGAMLFGANRRAGYMGRGGAMGRKTSAVGALAKGATIATVGALSGGVGGVLLATGAGALGAGIGAFKGAKGLKNVYNWGVGKYQAKNKKLKAQGKDVQNQIKRLNALKEKQGGKLSAKDDKRLTRLQGADGKGGKAAKIAEQKKKVRERKHFRNQI